MQVFYSRNLGHPSSVLVLLSLPASGGSHLFILHNALFQKHIVSHASSPLLRLWRTQQQSRYWKVSDIYTLLNIGISFCLSWTCPKAKKKFLWTWCLHNTFKKKKRKQFTFLLFRMQTLSQAVCAPWIHSSTQGTSGGCLHFCEARNLRHTKCNLKKGFPSGLLLCVSLQKYFIMWAWLKHLMNSNLKMHFYLTYEKFWHFPSSCR